MIVVYFNSMYSFLGAFAKFRKAAISFVVFRWNNTAPTGLIFMKIDVWVLLYNPLEELKIN